MIFDPVQIGEAIAKGTRALRAMMNSAAEESRTHERTRRGSAYLNPALAAYLSTVHPHQLLARGGLIYPVKAVARPKGQNSKPDSILGELEEIIEGPERWAVHDPDYAEELRKRGKVVENNPTYAFASITDAGGIKIHCRLGHYEDALNTCDILEAEILDALGADELPDSEFCTFGKRLPLRNQFLQRVKDPTATGEGRSAALSVSTLIIYKDVDSYWAFLRQRSQKTAAHSELYHVVPSGIFQPQYGYVGEEFWVELCIYREYLEEVFNDKRLKKSTGQISPAWFVDNPDFPELIYLRELLKQRSAELVLTGYAVNVLNYRPEICTLLLIHDPNWTKREIKNSWEFANGNPFRVDVTGDDHDIAQQLRKFPGTFVPPGAAAFWMGVDIARRHFKQKRIKRERN